MINENDLGIETLDLRWQARESDLDLPVAKWGSRSRKEKFRGLYHFYTWDYRFTGLLRAPETLLKTKCKVVVEANFSTWDDLPMWEAIQTIGQKRRLSAFWARQGVRLFVDLNVSRAHRHLGLVGVPRGWRTYATRAHRSGGPEAIVEDHAYAVAHAGTEDVIFFVYGGGRQIRDCCIEHGWYHAAEHMQMVSPK